MKGTDGIDVLLVEDDADDARFIERLLTEFETGNERLIQFGEITRTGRLDEALVVLDGEPDIVLLDLNLPDSEGLETLDAIVDRAPHIPIVVITGQTDLGLGTAAIREGAQDYLQKGRITGEVLHRTIRYAVDRHETQREIVELNRRLSLLNRIVGQDIRNDINMIVGRGDELRSRLEGDAEQAVASLLDAASRAVERTDKASELLAVLSTDHNPELESVDLGASLDEQLDQLRETNDVDLVVERKAVEDELLVGAIPLLGSAIGQLLQNAIQHTDSDRPRVTVTVEATDRRVTLSIADDGVGIPQRQRELLNDAEARYHERSGIGTGLYHALIVVEMSGGEIEFGGNDPRGTVVTVTLDKAGAADAG